ncbi:MAG TPA: ABC transporter substrate-binding protein, partial [Candidatus Methanofastidiosa archaeon]|nr:ABC transporter substrate-binding protein [Candidatus Methanofastidiosa archaeon]
MKRIPNHSFKSFFKLISVISLIAIIVCSSGCISGGDGDTDDTNGDEGVTLTVITRHDTSIQEAFEEGFLDSDYAKDANITKLRFMQPVSGLWPTAIENGGIDVAWGGGPTLFDQLMELDYLAPLTEDILPEMADIEDSIGGAAMKRYSDGEVVWIAAAISSFGFTVNHDVLDAYGLDTPDTWDDLADLSYYKDPPVIGIGNAPDTTSNTRIYEIILQNYGWDLGWEKLTEIAANSGIYYGSVDVLNAVETGTIAIGTTIDFYGYSSMESYDYTEYIIPTGQSLLNGDPIALVEGSEKTEAALAFIGYVLSPEGQSIWLLDNINRMPVTDAAFDTEFGMTRTNLEELYNITISNQGIEFSENLALSYEGTMVIYWEAVLDKPHNELVAAWDALIDAWNEGKITQAQWDHYVEMLGEPLITMETAQDINDSMLMDSAFANDKSVEWANEKQEVYEQVK